MTMTRDPDPMGLKLRTPMQCGRCGKPRGLAHTCVTSAAGRRRRGHTKARSPLMWECSTCHKPRGLVHTCTLPSDFKKRRRQAATADRRRKRKATAAKRAARRKKAAADRRARDRARKQAAKKRPATPRRRSGDSHEPGTCGDRDCPKYGCKAYWAGMDDCPGPHEGE
jgi:hypothetical protein